MEMLMTGQVLGALMALIAVPALIALGWTGDTCQGMGEITVKEDK